MIAKRRTRGPAEPTDGRTVAIDADAQAQIESTPGAARFERKEVARP